MFFTSIHGAYWSARKAPAWARAAMRPGPTIDQCVNAHAAIGRTRHSDADALVGQLRGAPIEAAMAYLADVAKHGGGVNARRAAYATRWRKRVRDERTLQWWIARAGVPIERQPLFDRESARYWSVDLPMPEGVHVLALIAQSVSHRDISHYETHENSGWPPRGAVFDESTPLKKSSAAAVALAAAQARQAF